MEHVVFMTHQSLLASPLFPQFQPQVSVSRRLHLSIRGIFMGDQRVTLSGTILEVVSIPKDDKDGYKSDDNVDKFRPIIP